MIDRRYRSLHYLIPPICYFILLYHVADNMMQPQREQVDSRPKEKGQVTGKAHTTCQLVTHTDRGPVYKTHDLICSFLILSALQRFFSLTNLLTDESRLATAAVHDITTSLVTRDDRSVSQCKRAV